VDQTIAKAILRRKALAYLHVTEMECGVQERGVRISC
jgi:hypothetical protein